MSGSDDATALKVKLEKRDKEVTKLKAEVKEVEQKLAEALAVDEAELTNDELATELVAVMSKELHLRVGIGPIWRQLNPTRKQEIMDKWQADTEVILGESR